MFPQLVLADWGETFLYVGCNKEKKSFEIQPLIIWNDTLDSVMPTVERSNGTVNQNGYYLYRIKNNPTISTTCKVGNTNLQVTLKYGTLELHEEDKLIVSLKIKNVWDFYGYVYQVKYNESNKWEEFCSSEKSYGEKKWKSEWRPINTKRLSTNCNKENNNTNFHNNRPFDILSNFDFSDKPMVYKTIKSTHEVCDIALDEVNSRILEKTPAINNLLREHSDKGEFITPNGKPYKTFTSPSLFDFDNDGMLDRVFSYSNAGSYITGDIFYVEYGDQNKTISTKDKLTIENIKIFPCQFDNSIIKSSSCPTISQGADGAGIDVSFESGESLFFRGRYTSMTPFKYKNKTYLILRSNSQSTENSAAVIYPYSKTNFKSVCLFKRQP